MEGSGGISVWTNPSPIDRGMSATVVMGQMSCILLFTTVLSSSPAAACVVVTEMRLRCTSPTSRTAPSFCRLRRSVRVARSRGRTEPVPAVA